MTIVADATALILLGKASVLEAFSSRSDLRVPETVYREATETKKTTMDSMLIQKLNKEGKLKSATPSEKTRKYLQGLLGLNKGELDVIAIAAHKKFAVLSDDKKCINAARTMGIEIITSPDAVVSLWKKQAISKEKAVNAIDILDEYGWYSKSIMKNYKEMVK